MFAKKKPGLDPCANRSLPRVLYMALTILCERVIIAKNNMKTVANSDMLECLEEESEHSWLKQLPAMNDTPYEKKKFIVIGLRRKYQAWEPREYKKWIAWKNECIKLAKSL